MYAAGRMVGWLFFRKPNEYFAGERIDGRERIVRGWGDFGTRCAVCDENVCALDGDVEDFGGEKPYSSNGDGLWELSGDGVARGFQAKDDVDAIAAEGVVPGCLRRVGDEIAVF